MKIAVNTRFLIKDALAGIGTYTQELFSRVVKLMPEHQFYFYFDRKFDDAFIYSENIVPKMVFPPARHALLWYAWFEYAIPYRLKQDKIDLFVSPDGYCSLSTNVSQLLTIHDLAFEHYPQFIPKIVADYYKKYTPQFCKKADKIIAVSEYTKNDIINQYSIFSDKIEVIYNGVDFKEINTGSKPGIRIDFPYFIFIGTFHPRKNILRLLKAFNAYKHSKSNQMKLFLIGSDGWMNEDLLDYLENMVARQEVIWIKNCQREEIYQYLSCAAAMIYPSLFEGFGIPIIEAMHCGIPVACSNTSCLPEIAGDAAIYFNPENEDEIKDSMQLLSENMELRKQLGDKGKQRAGSFSWDIAAQKMTDSIRSLLLR